MAFGLTITEWETCIHALRVAADQFKEDAVVAISVGEKRLAAQFQLQETESRELADRIEEGYR